MLFLRKRVVRTPLRRVRRGRIVRRRVHRPIGSGMMAKNFFKLRQVDTVQVNVNNTTTVVNVSDDPSGATDWISVANMFGFYRVNALKLKYIRQFTAQALLTVGTTSTGIGLFPAYVIHDVNQIALPSTRVSNDFVAYENMKIVNFRRPWGYYRKMVRNVSIELRGLSPRANYTDRVAAAGRRS